MRALLQQQRCVKAIGNGNDLPENMKASDKQDAMDKAHSFLILNLANNILRQMDGKDTTTKIWTKLESLYMVKSFSNKLYLKDQLFGFQDGSHKSLEDNLDDFKKITVSLANIDEKISYEN